MADPKVQKLADIMIDYSFGKVDFRKEWVENKKGLWLRYKASADELAQTIAEKVFDIGGNVFLEQVPAWWDYTFFTKASDAVLNSHPDEYLFRLKTAAARLVVLSDSNTQSLANVKPERRTMRNKAITPYVDEAMRTDADGNFTTPWCGVIFPTEAYAQDMGMSLGECEEYIFNAMYLDQKDPVETWRRIAIDQRKMIMEVLSKAKNITIVDRVNDAKLGMSVEDHRWINADGHLNFPDDEIFNAPRKDSVNGVLTIPKLPQYDHGGPEVRDITLEFKDGKVIKWDAKVGKNYLDEFLTKNPGADHIGEVAFGRHPRIDRISKQILLDEKMGGTLHFALGRAYQLHVLGDGDKSGLNQSVVHWDLIKDMRDGLSYVKIDDKFRITWKEHRGEWFIEKLYSV